MAGPGPRRASLSRERLREGKQTHVSEAARSRAHRDFGSGVVASVVVALKVVLTVPTTVTAPMITIEMSAAMSRDAARRRFAQTNSPRPSSITRQRGTFAPVTARRALYRVRQRQNGSRRYPLTNSAGALAHASCFSPDLHVDRALTSNARPTFFRQRQ